MMMKKMLIRALAWRSRSEIKRWVDQRLGRTHRPQDRRRRVTSNPSSAA
jgi:hypothetical protein